MCFFQFTTTLFFISCTLLAQEPSTKYISIYGIQSHCNISPHKTEKEHYIDVDLIVPGATLWISGGSVSYFEKHVLPYIYTPFVLIIQGSDESFPTSWQNVFDTEAFIANPYILQIFSQNCDYLGPQKHKVSHIPIGIDLHTLTKNKSAFDEKQASVQKQENDLDKVLASLSPTTKRKKKSAP